MILAAGSLASLEVGTISAHSLRSFSLPCHDPAGGWITAGGGCRVDDRFASALADLRPGEGSKL
jgi:hypothetical protein